MRYRLTSVFFLAFSSSLMSAEHPTTDAHYEQVIREMCAANRAPVARTKGTQIFSWTDEHGQVHFGDRPPANTDVQRETLQGRKDYFEMTVSFPSGATNSEIGDALQVNGHAIAQALSRLIPAERMTKSSIEMKVFNNRVAFMRHKQTLAPGLSNNVDGFYSALDNTVAVWHNGNDDYAQQIALHEATHVFQYKNIGMMPGWLTEGMADYFASLRVQGSAKVVPVNPYWLWYLQQQRQIIPVQTLMSAHYSQFQGNAGATYYANSWALVYFLMRPENRPLMERYLADVSQDKCDDMPDAHSVSFFEQHYSGGIEKLQQDWMHWLASSHDVPNYH
ncbi:DUF1570 domain-containing protein [Reinekea sp. G2M2-21]|uniref:DUF1570 domain-containing protein n=1 Tax=Reinekea sp. G2M2-21 TaxID=2788942 RepID=UPI0018A9E1D7|nr:DUF1570 domain-containing protein [Reinekea sp. G2M2-21]